jgi:quercetin dioxygenase-like cupin family protein
VSIGDRVERLTAGDTFIVPSNVVHGVKALDAGRLIDTFTPHRADFLE